MTEQRPVAQDIAARVKTMYLGLPLRRETLEMASIMVHAEVIKALQAMEVDKPERMLCGYDVSAGGTVSFSLYATQDIADFVREIGFSDVFTMNAEPPS